MYFINLDKKLGKGNKEPKEPKPKGRKKKTKLPIVEVEVVTRYVTVPNSGTAVHNLESKSKTMAEYHKIDDQTRAMLSERRNRTFKDLSAPRVLLETIIVKDGIILYSSTNEEVTSFRIEPELLSVYQKDDATIDTFVQIGDNVLPKDLMGYTRVDVNSAVVVGFAFRRVMGSTYIVAVLDNGDSIFVERLTVVPHKITQVSR